MRIPLLVAAAFVSACADSGNDAGDGPLLPPADGALAGPDAADAVLPPPDAAVLVPDAAASIPDVAVLVPDAAGPPAPAPTALAALVREDELRATVAALSDLGTRYTYSDGDEAARDYLVGRLRAQGYEPELDAFTFDGETAENVIARKPGAETPDVVYLYSAHYDSTAGEPNVSAPGADDNASAVAAGLEAVRLLTPLRLRASVWFVFTAAEEQGSLGSAHLAARLVREGVDVRGVIAPDMIGYWPLGENDALDLLGDSSSVALVDRMAALADTLGVPYKRWIQHDYCYGDDHTNYQEAGFPGISPMDCVEAHNVPAAGETLPHYHDRTDTLDTLDLPFTTRVAGLIVATLADLAEPLAP